MLILNLFKKLPYPKQCYCYCFRSFLDREEDYDDDDDDYNMDDACGHRCCLGTQYNQYIRLFRYLNQLLGICKILHKNIFELKSNLIGTRTTCTSQHSWFCTFCSSLSKQVLSRGTHNKLPRKHCSCFIKLTVLITFLFKHIIHTVH